MGERFFTDQMPEVDANMLQRGLCPWCVCRLNDGDLMGEPNCDVCPECGDVFDSTPPRNRK